MDFCSQCYAHLSENAQQQLTLFVQTDPYGAKVIQMTKQDYEATWDRILDEEMAFQYISESTEKEATKITSSRQT